MKKKKKKISEKKYNS